MPQCGLHYTSLCSSSLLTPFEPMYEILFADGRVGTVDEDTAIMNEPIV